MTVEQIHSPISADDTYSKTESDRLTCQDIGLIFAREYYTFLNRKPSRLHGFYGADSLLVRGDEAESVPIVKGQEEIRKKIEELDFDNCKVLVTQVDSQVSSNDGILVSVLGEISNKDMPSQKFAETFFLAPQPNGYYVLNNIFRFLKEKVDIDYYLCEDDGEARAEKSNQHKKRYATDVQETKDMRKKEVHNETVVQSPLLSPPPIQVEEKKPVKYKKSVKDKRPLEDEKLVEDKKPVEDNVEDKRLAGDIKVTEDGKPVEDEKIVEDNKLVDDKKPIEEKKHDEPKAAMTSSKPSKEAEEVTTRKEKAPVKNIPVHNKRPEDQINRNSSSLSNIKEQTNSKNNEITATPTKDQIKNNQKGGASKPTSTNTANTGNSEKTWAALAAPTPPSDPISGQPQSANDNQPNRTQAPQVSHSPKLNVQSNIPNQHQTSYNNQNHPSNTHHYPHQQQQTQNHHQQQHNKDQPQQQTQYRKETQIFVKNVNPSMTEEQLTNAFCKFGTVKSVNFNHNKNCAFVEFGSIESTQKALEQHKVTIGGNQHVYAEERRPPRYNRPYTDNNNRRYQQHNRRGSGIANRGGTGVDPLDKRGGGGQK